MSHVQVDTGNMADICTLLMMWYTKASKTIICATKAMCLGQLTTLPAQSIASTGRDKLGVACEQGGAYVVSASSDETCKVWDCRRLERDVSFRSRLTYDAKVWQLLLCLCTSHRV